MLLKPTKSVIKARKQVVAVGQHAFWVAETVLVTARSLGEPCIGGQLARLALRNAQCRCRSFANIKHWRPHDTIDVEECQQTGLSGRQGLALTET